jgi:Tfp pilus assembly protein PilV
MVELLLTAAILAIGILGLSALQAMSVRSAGSTRSVETAVGIANRILDAAATESRLSWNNLQAATTATLPTAVYLIPGATLTEYYGADGNLLGSGGTPAANTIFTAVTTGTAGLAGANALAGRTSLIQVTVTFQETPTRQRRVTLQRSLKSA